MAEALSRANTATASAARRRSKVSRTAESAMALFSAKPAKMPVPVTCPVIELASASGGHCRYVETSAGLRTYRSRHNHSHPCKLDEGSIPYARSRSLRRSASVFMAWRFDHEMLEVELMARDLIAIMADVSP